MHLVDNIATIVAKISQLLSPSNITIRPKKPDFDKYIVAVLCMKTSLHLFSVCVRPLTERKECVLKQDKTQKWTGLAINSLIQAV